MTQIIFNQHKIERDSTVATMKNGDFAILVGHTEINPTWMNGSLLFKNGQGTISLISNDGVALVSEESLQYIFTSFKNAKVRILKKVEIREIE